MVIGGQAPGPTQDKPYGCLGTQMEEVGAQGSNVSDWTMRSSSDLATGAESRALSPFPSVSRNISMGPSGSPN